MTRESARPQGVRAIVSRLASWGARDRLSQLAHGGLRAAEQSLWESFIPQNVGIDRVALVQIQAKPGQVLQSQVAVVVDRRVGQILLQVGRPARVVGKKIDR